MINCVFEADGKTGLTDLGYLGGEQCYIFIPGWWDHTQSLSSAFYSFFVIYAVTTNHP